MAKVAQRNQAERSGKETAKGKSKALANIDAGGKAAKYQQRFWLEKYRGGALIAENQ